MDCSYKYRDILLSHLNTFIFKVSGAPISTERRGGTFEPNNTLWIDGATSTTRRVCLTTLGGQSPGSL